MLKTEFQRIAKEEGATLTIKDEKINIGGGVRSPNLVFYLTLTYNNRVIKIHNATGTYFSGRVSCVISKPKESLEFEITTKSHFSNLFSIKKDRFKIKSRNENMKSFLRHSNGLKALLEIAKDTVFEPTILGQNSEEEFDLTTEYHLQFANWTQVIKPFILFYKEFIDKFG